MNKGQFKQVDSTLAPLTDYRKVEGLERGVVKYRVCRGGGGEWVSRGINCKTNTAQPKLPGLKHWGPCWFLDSFGVLSLWKVVGFMHFTQVHISTTHFFTGILNLYVMLLLTCTLSLF